MTRPSNLLSKNYNELIIKKQLGQGESTELRVVPRVSGPRAVVRCPSPPQKKNQKQNKRARRWHWR